MAAEAPSLSDEQAYGFAWNIGRVQNNAHDRRIRAEKALEGIALVREIGVTGLSVRKNVRPDLQHEVARGTEDFDELTAVVEEVLPDRPGYQSER